MTISIVIRADGGSEIGYGHLIRSNALTEEIHTAGHTVTVATKTPEVAKAVFPDTVDTVELPSRGDPVPFVEWLKSAKPDVVFTDAYPVDTAYQQAIREHVPLAVLQDDSRYSICADLLINSNLYGSKIEYDFIGTPPETCFGSKYLLLREEISKQITGEAEFSPKPTSLLLLMGGSDVRNSTPGILQAIGGSKYVQKVTVVMGPGCDTTDVIRDSANNLSQPVECVRDPSDLPTRMFDADIAITSTGTTVYELLGLQTPFIGIPQIENQIKIAESLKKRDLASIVEKRPHKATVETAINDLIDNIKFRKMIHRRGPKVVDGKGAGRVADQLIRLGTR